MDGYNDKMFETDPALLTFPQEQPNGDVFHSLFDVLMEKPTGLTCKDFCLGVPQETIMEWWREAWKDTPQEANHSQQLVPVIHQENINVVSHAKKSASSHPRKRNPAGNSGSGPESGHRRTYEPLSMPLLSIEAGGNGSNSRDTGMSVTPIYNSEVMQRDGTNSLRIYRAPRYSEAATPTSRSREKSTPGSSSPRNLTVACYEHPSLNSSRTTSNSDDEMSESSGSSIPPKPKRPPAPRPAIMICRFCGSDFKGKDVEYFICHLALKEQVECLFCAESFGCEGAWTSHCKKIHMDRFPAINPDCHICGKTFGTRAKMTNHMLTHTKQKNFKCAACDNTYRTNRTLLAHITEKDDKKKKPKKEVKIKKEKKEKKASTKKTPKVEKVPCVVVYTDYPSVMSCL